MRLDTMRVVGHWNPLHDQTEPVFKPTSVMAALYNPSEKIQLFHLDLHGVNQ